MPFSLRDTNWGALEGGRPVHPAGLRPCKAHSTTPNPPLALFCTASLCFARISLRAGQGVLKVVMLFLCRLPLVQYKTEDDLALVMRLIDNELSEPYSIFTYRYFIYNWPNLCYLAFDASTGHAFGTVVCKLDDHRGTMRGYLAMLTVEKEYRGKMIGALRFSHCHVHHSALRPG